MSEVLLFKLNFIAAVDVPVLYPVADPANRIVCAAVVFQVHVYVASLVPERVIVLLFVTSFAVDVNVPLSPQSTVKLPAADILN